MKTSAENRIQNCALLAYNALMNPNMDVAVKKAAWYTLMDNPRDIVQEVLGCDCDFDFMFSYDDGFMCIATEWLIDSDDELMQRINELRLQMAMDIVGCVYCNVNMEYNDSDEKNARVLKYVEDCKKTLNLLGSEMDVNPMCHVDDPEMLNAVVKKYGPRENNVYTVAEVYDRAVALSWANHMNQYVNREFPAHLEKYWSYCLGRMAHSVYETNE